jgi:hypothetical protein
MCQLVESMARDTLRGSTSSGGDTMNPYSFEELDSCCFVRDQGPRYHRYHRCVVPQRSQRTLNPLEKRG